MLRTLTLTALAAYVSAQSLSSGCTSALSSIAFNPEAAACLNPVALVSVISGNATQSVVPAINNWLTGLCGAAPCSNATIAAVVANVTTGCSTELSATGVTSSAVGGITTLIQQYYPTARKVLCLKDGSKNCITQTLENIEGVVGTLSVTNIVQLALNPPTTLPANVTCTDCVKAAYNVIAADIPSITTDVAPALQSQCGASFADGKTPSNIVESAAQSSSASQSSAAAPGSFKPLSQSLVGGLAVSGLIVASTAFTLLA